eukprot:6880075-Prymnesium_polylepis.1
MECGAWSWRRPISSLSNGDLKIPYQVERPARWHEVIRATSPRCSRSSRRLTPHEDHSAMFQVFVAHLAAFDNVTQLDYDPATCEPE